MHVRIAIVHTSTVVCMTYCITIIHYKFIVPDRPDPFIYQVARGTLKGWLCQTSSYTAV